MSGLNDAVANRLRDNGRGPCVGRKTTPPSMDRGKGKERWCASPSRLCFSLPFSLSLFFLSPSSLVYTAFIDGDTVCVYPQR